MTTQNRAGKEKGRKQRDQVDVFADMMEAGAFGDEEGTRQESFVDAFSSAVAAPTAPASLAARLAQEYGFKPSKEQSFDIPIDRVLDSPYQQRLDRSLWSEKQRREYERLRLAVREGLNEVFFVAPFPEKSGCFFLAYGGHNRRDVAREEGHTTIPCIIIAYDPDNETDEEKVGFGTTFENEVRVPLTLEEHGLLYRQLMQRFKLSQEKLGKRLDLTRDVIKDCLMVAESPQDIRELVRELEEGSGVRIARSLGRLEKLREITENEDAPRVARAPLIEAYRTGKMKTELIEAYIDEILRLAQASPRTQIEEILHQVFHTASEEAAQVEAPGDGHRHDQEFAPSMLTSQGTTSGVVEEAQYRSTADLLPTRQREPQEERADLTIPIATARPQPAENAQRLDKLLKAQKYLKAYRRLATGMSKGNQEVRILTDMSAEIQEELDQPEESR